MCTATEEQATQDMASLPTHVVAVGLMANLEKSYLTVNNTDMKIQDFKWQYVNAILLF